MSKEHQKEIEELKAKNHKLREQFSGLLDSYAKLELTDLKRNQQAENQKKLIEFIQRIAKRLDDDDLLDVLVEEFLLELKADRVSYILPGSGPNRRLAVSNEAVDRNIGRLALPYFLATETDRQYTDMLHMALETGELMYSKWKGKVTVVPDVTVQLPLEQSFHNALEEEFHVVASVDCESAMAFPIRTSIGGDSVICLQRSQNQRHWSESQKELFKDMCRYAGLLLEQTQLTQQIRDLKDQLSSIIQSMPSAIIGIDLLGTVTMWGGRAEELLGVNEDEALGRVFWELVPEYEFVSNAIMDVMSLEGQGGLDFDDLPYKKHDGTVVYHHANLFTMFGSNRGELALRIDDVTKNVELNNQLFHAQRMEVVGTLAGGLAHDFNNVLGGLVGTLSLLKQRCLKSLDSGEGDSHKLKEDLADIEIIETCTSRASDMVKRLLSVSRKTHIHKEAMDIGHSVKNIAKLCRASFDSRIKVESSIVKDKLWVSGDRTQLEQVMLNLCVNARDAIKNEGKISLKVRPVQVTENFKKKHRDIEGKELICLSISDTGQGIPLENFDKIFDPFFTTKLKEQGTGLGLSIVYKIVKEHDGIIELDSEVGVGSTFNIYLKPVKEGERGAEEEAKASMEGTGDILVVDDDEIMRKTISRILFGMGYTVATAASGGAAIRMFESGIHFNLIVLDVDMPVMSGLDTTRIIRSKKPDMKILYCTARQNQYQMHDELEKPNTWLINKPFSLEELGRMVKNCLSDNAL